MREPLLDDDGENRAVRAFLMHYGAPGLTVKQQRDNMRSAGFIDYWPMWVGQVDGHLTKACAQSWLRYLFALEGKDGVPVLQPVQLAVGRRYRVRNGATVHINESGVGCLYGDFGPGNQRRRYTPDGRYCGQGAQPMDPWDIVADEDGVAPSDGGQHG